MDENNEIVEVEEEITVQGNDTIKISNEAVATYAGIAVSEVHPGEEQRGTCPLSELRKGQCADAADAYSPENLDFDEGG